MSSIGIPGLELPQHYLIDACGELINTKSLFRYLSGTQQSGTPSNQRLNTDENTTVLIYLTGHGASGILKFQDWEQLTANDLANALSSMQTQKRYDVLYLLVDTCQGSSLFDKIKTHGILGMSTSKEGESSYAMYPHPELGAFSIDRGTYFIEKFIASTDPEVSLDNFFNFLSKDKLKSMMNYKSTLKNEEFANVCLNDVFGYRRDLHLSVLSGTAGLGISNFPGIKT